MNRLSNQKGSAHVVVIVVLVAALLFALGWIFWQNFILKEAKTSDNAKPIIIKKDETKNSIKTYADKTSGVSFDYPSNWSVEPMTTTGSLMVTVNDSSDKPVAYLETKLSGLGGAGVTTFSTLASQKLSQGAYACAVYENDMQGSTKFFYGISADTEKCGSVTTGDGGRADLGMFIDAGNDKTGMISFGNLDVLGGKYVNELNDEASAKQFVASSEYQQIQTMMASLKY